MRKTLCACLIGAFALIAPLIAFAQMDDTPIVVIMVSTVHHTMQVWVNGNRAFPDDWVVSTGVGGDHETPIGIFTPYRLEAEHVSWTYHEPMRYVIFFDEADHVAIHVANDEAELGKSVSHGCIWLSTENALTLFELVSNNGVEHTRIIIS